MSEAARVAAARRAEARPKFRVGLNSVAVGGLAVAAGIYYAVCGLLIHLSFHSSGWDLGIFDQVLWSIAHGHGFHYSFRDMPYLGDHFQPVLILLAPLVFLKPGAAPILVVQGLAFGAAVIPLHAAARRIAGGTPRAVLADGSPTPHQKKEVSGDTLAPPLPSPLAAATTKAVSVGTFAAETRGMAAAWGLSVAYVLSLGAARSVSFDFHPECFVPLLAFTALWGLAAQRPWVFFVASLGLLPIKEDAAFLVLGLCWVAWLGFGQRKPAQWMALASAAYFVVISMVVMREIADGVSSPLTERYPYLGHSASSIAFHAITRPDLIFDHLRNWDTPRTLLYLFAGTGFLALLRPKLLLPMVLLLGPPLLAVNAQQRMLELHYGVVPYAYTFVVAAMVLERGYLEGLVRGFAPPRPSPQEKKRPGDTPRAPGMGPRPLHLRFSRTGLGRSVGKIVGGWHARSERSLPKEEDLRDTPGAPGMGLRPLHLRPGDAGIAEEEKGLEDAGRPGDSGEAGADIGSGMDLRPLHLRFGGSAWERAVGKLFGGGGSGTVSVRTTETNDGGGFAAHVPSPPPLSLGEGEGRLVVGVSVVVAVLAVVMFAWKSPLPPSFAAHLDQFEVDHHSRVAETFVDMVPGDAVVSAQASFVPHLSERYDIFEFPRITARATIVLIDDKRYVPGYDAPAYDSCRAKLPAFGFMMVRSEDGIELWERSEADARRLGSEGCG